MVPRITPIEDTQASPELRGLFRIPEERSTPNSVLLRILARDPDSMRTY